MTSSNDDENLVLSELDRPPSPFLASAMSSGARIASNVLKRDVIDAVQGTEDGGIRQTTDPSWRTKTSERKPGVHIPRKIRVVCPYWYHFGLCEKSDEVCKYSHALSEFTEKMAFMPMKDRSHACGLPLCKFKDGPVPKPTTSATTFNRGDPSQPARPNRITKNTNDIRNQGTKRQFPHRDAPTSAQKRAKFMDYDDQADCSSRGSDDSKVTCFFWYHGSCGRAEDERNGYKCSFKHGLTKPPTMVQPPPGYVHRTLCTRDWCPGDARDKPARRDSGIEVFGEGGSATNKEALAESNTAATTTAAPTEEWFLKGFNDVD